MNKESKQKESSHTTQDTTENTNIPELLTQIIQL